MKAISKTLTSAALTAGIMLLAPGASAMALDDWGTSAGSGTLTCAGFSLPDCGVGTGPTNSGPSVDNVMGTFAESSVVSPRGSGQSSALLSLASGISTPELKAYGAGTAGGSGTAGIGQGFAGAIEGYTYNGPGTTIDLNIELSGTITNPNNRSFTSINATVYILDPADFAFGGFGTINLQGFLGEGIFPLDSTTLILNSSGNTMSSLTLDLMDGDQFYVYASLSASAANGAVADALSTLDMSFSSNVGLTAASVPLPAGLWLLGSAALALVGAGRRRFALPT